MEEYVTTMREVKSTTEVIGMLQVSRRIFERLIESTPSLRPERRFGNAYVWDAASIARVREALAVKAKARKAKAG